MKKIIFDNKDLKTIDHDFWTESSEMTLTKLSILPGLQPVKILTDLTDLSVGQGLPDLKFTGTKFSFLVCQFKISSNMNFYPSR